MSKAICTCHCGGSMFYKHLHDPSCDLFMHGEEAPQSKEAQLQAALDAEREKVKNTEKAYQEKARLWIEQTGALTQLQVLVRAVSDTMEPFRKSLAKLDEVDTLATRRIAEADAYYCAQRVLATLDATTPAKFTKEELSKWWHAQCPQCGWNGLSRDCAGGEPLADTGDFNDPMCPMCAQTGRCVVVDDYVEPKGGDGE